MECYRNGESHMLFDINKTINYVLDILPQNNQRKNEQIQSFVKLLHTFP